MDKTKSLVMTVLGATLTGCGTFEGWPTVADYFKYCRNVKKIPKDWAWESEGNWYRSPDGKQIWYDGEILPSAEGKDSDIKDTEILRKGDHRYSPAYIGGEYESRSELQKMHMQHSMQSNARALRWQPRHYNTRPK